MLVLPRRARELRFEHLRRVHLHDDLALEIAARVKAEVFVRGAREAVVADYSVGDEIARAGRDVVQALFPHGFDGDDSEIRKRLDHLTLN